MATNLYTDANPEPAQAAPPTPEQPKAPTPKDEPTAPIPKALLAGKEFKPGDVVEFKIVQVMDDSVLIEYNHGDEGYEKGETPESPAEPETRGGGGMASIME
jgi:hypothetical protein